MINKKPVWWAFLQKDKLIMMICILLQHLNDHLCLLIARQYAIPFTLQHLAVCPPNTQFHSGMGQIRNLLAAFSDYCPAASHTVLHCYARPSNTIFAHIIMMAQTSHTHKHQLMAIFQVNRRTRFSLNFFFHLFQAKTLDNNWFLQAGCPTRHPIYSVKALKWTQSDDTKKNRPLNRIFSWSTTGFYREWKWLPLCRLSRISTINMICIPVDINISYTTWYWLHLPL